MNAPALYPEMILDHYRNPRNRRPLAADAIHAEGDNPNCGDHVALHLETEGSVIRDACFDGQGCAICMASASIMTEMVRGTTMDDALLLCETFIGFMRGDGELEPDRFGDLVALSSVRQFPMRTKCATLPLQALQRAVRHLQGPGEKQHGMEEFPRNDT